jgi:pimeloyl-ACP methyl ester carboxylesterase
MSAPRPQVFWRARGSGPPLVLVNGYGASAFAWPRRWTRGLEGRYRVITMDNRGAGASRHVDVPFSMGDLADDVVDVLDAAAAGAATVLGLSMGGMIAQELALRHPERVSALVLVATRPPVPRFTPPPMGSALAMSRPPGRGQPLDAYFRALWVRSAAPGFADREPEILDELTRQSVAWPTPRGLLVHQLRAMTAWAHADRLRRITAPTAVVHGVLDRMSPVRNGRTIAELIPGARYVELDGAGHLVPHEAPERLDEIIDEMTSGFANGR